MDFGPAVNTFVPLWIFAPLLLVGVIGLLCIPRVDSSRSMRSREGQAHARNGAMPPNARTADLR